MASFSVVRRMFCAAAETAAAPAAAASRWDRLKNSKAGEKPSTRVIQTPQLVFDIHVGECYLIHWLVLHEFTVTMIFAEEDNDKKDV